MECKKMIIKVSDVAEFPTQLGMRCKLFAVRGYNAYSDTEEKLMAALESFKGDPEALEICKSSSRCGAFWHLYQQGITPFLDKERIIASHYNGKYWIDEGKHRTCMAMMAGIEEIEVDVWDSGGWRVRLDPVGNSGEYEFSYTYRACPLTPVTLGTAALLWVSALGYDDDKRFEAHPVMLTSDHNTDGVYLEIIKGVSYKVDVHETALKPLSVSVSSTVKIDTEHPLTKVWILRRDFSKDERTLSEMDTLYRRGCYRQRDLGDLQLKVPRLSGKLPYCIRKLFGKKT
ncbi:MAG: hypothetical protein FWC20_00585 [Oscillospiraceae bacterium]|nr:hypothetical protein [Oscillospiraceae bacterium]MCL2277889.1 hypothetical protein [Oscillospiraceae bacterium]